MQLRLNAPRLTELTLDLVHIRTIPHPTTLQQITKLKVEITTYHLATYRDVLKNCPLLTDCSIVISPKMKNMQWNIGQFTITLSHLKTFSIEANLAMVTLLSQINTPALQVLNIFMPPYATVKASSLLPFIQKSPTIMHIAATGVNVPREQENFEHDIKFTHPDIFITWKQTNKITRLIYQEEYISGSDTEPDFMDRVLEADEEGWESEE
jgi:hypothetical protein